MRWLSACCLSLGAQPFGTILNLVPLAESVVKLTAVCMECFREAAYTKRLGTEKEVAPPAFPAFPAACGVGVWLCLLPVLALHLSSVPARSR